MFEPRRIRLAYGLALTVLCLTFVPTALGKGKPDLIVSPGALKGQPYHLLGERNKASTVSFTTGNRGGSSSGSTVTRVTMFLKGSKKGYRFGDEAVPGLDGGTVRGGEAADKLDGKNFRQGAYKIQICADALDQERESDEKNNCKKLRGSFYITYPTWFGAVSGTGPLFNAAGDTLERWSSKDFAYDFGQYLGRGIFQYQARGTVSYVDSGTDQGGCTWTGAGTTTSLDPAFGLTTNLEDETYFGLAAWNIFSYPQFQTCGGDAAILNGPSQPFVLVTDSQLLPAGTKRLSGAGTPADGNDAIYTWDLAGGEFER